MTIRFDSEKSLEDALFSAPKLLSDELGISSNATLHRQLTLPGYGVVDIAAIDVGPGITMVTIIELKNEKLTSNDAAQLCRYMNYFEKHAESTIFDVSGILIGPTTYPNSNDDVFLMQSLNSITVFEFDLDIETGMKLSEVVGWTRSNTWDHDHSWLESYVMASPEYEQ